MEDTSKDMNPIIYSIKRNIERKSKTRVYKIWPGKHRFCCFGYLMTGPVDDTCQNIYTWSCILGIGIPYMVFVTPILFKNVTPVIPIINGFLFFATVTSLCLTGWTDPGIIPRKYILDLEKGKKDLSKYLEKNGGDLSADDKVFCYTCKIWRPSRASHCTDCDCCIEVHDHHCPFVNNCVGKRNYQFFISFLTSLCLLILSVIVGLVAWGLDASNGDSEENTDQNDDEDQTRMIVLIVGIPLGIIGFVLILFCLFHVYLMITGKTTREKLKNKKKKSGKQANNIFFTDLSLINSRKAIAPDEQENLLTGINQQVNVDDDN